MGRGGKEENYFVWGEGERRELLCAGARGESTNRAEHTAKVFISHKQLCPVCTLPAPRPGGEILLLFDWLIHMRSYSDWLVLYEAGKITHPIKMPPRDERGLSIGKK